MTPSKPDDKDFSDSDQQWYDRLSGRIGPATDAKATREAEVLRGVIEQQAADAEARWPADTPADEERRWQQMRFRMRRAGVAEAPPRRRWWPAAAGLAAAMVLAVVLLPRLDEEGHVYDEPPAMRGEPRLLPVPAGKPRAAAEGFARTLREAGLRAGLYQKGKVFVVDVDLDAAEVAAAAPAFAPLGAPAAPGLTRVEFRPR